LCTFGPPFLFLKVKREWGDISKRGPNSVILFAAVLGIFLAAIFYYRIWFEIFRR
jgi:hypothetical protein